MEILINSHDEFPEDSILKQLANKISARDSDLFDAEIINSVHHKGKTYSHYIFRLGTSDPFAPSLGLIGGVHGLERIGAQTVISLLNTYLELTKWDQSLLALLKKIRLYFVPMVNPYGIRHMSRANGHGVDLMRNAPYDAKTKVPFLVGGQKFSACLPWYQGHEVQIENQILFEVVKKYSFQSRSSVTVDFHSGFGFVDQIWFGHEKKVGPFADIAHLSKIVHAYEQAHPSHFYKIEPQAYSVKGDVWDYLFEQHLQQRKNRDHFFIPLTLEMGSWMWLKKNPWQIFSSGGVFNPIKPHRQKRALRRHYTFIDFLVRSLASESELQNLIETQEAIKKAHQRWYENL